MSQQASVIMEGDFSDYTLKELLEVASLCRQLIEVSLSRGSLLQGQLLLKAGQLLEVKLTSSAQQGAQAFQSLLGSSFDQFRVVQLKGQPWANDPIGRLIDLMRSPAPAAPTAPTAPIAPILSSTPAALQTSRVTPAPDAPIVPAATPAHSATRTPAEHTKVTSKSPLPQLGRPPTPGLLNKPLSATPLPRAPALSSKASTLSSNASTLASAPALGSAEPDDHSATSVFSGAEVAELVTLISVIEQQRAALSEIDSECKQLGRYAQQLYAQLQSQGEQLTHQSSRGDQLASHQTSQLQQLHEAARHLNETQQAQSASLRQLLGYAQQSQGALEALRQSVQALDAQPSSAQPSERPDALSSQAAQTSDLMGGAVGSQLLLELARGRADKQSGHLTPLMVVSLFIQILSLILISVLVVKMLF